MPYEKYDEYENIMKLLNEELIINDLWLVINYKIISLNYIHNQKKFNKHLPTYGLNSEEGYDKVLTGKEDQNTEMTLDYMFEIYLDKEHQNKKSVYLFTSLIFYN